MCKGKTTKAVEKVAKNPVISNDELFEAVDLMIAYKASYEAKKRTFEETFTDALVEFFQTHKDVKYIETANGNRITFVDGCVKRVADVAKMKKDNVYDEYSKDQFVKPHLMCKEAK